VRDNQLLFLAANVMYIPPIALLLGEGSGLKSR